MSQNASDQSFSSEAGDDGSLGSENDDHEEVTEPRINNASGKKGLAAKKATIGSSKNPAKQPAKRGRKKRPKDMPQRPLSAYNLFFRREREIIIKTTIPDEIINSAEAIRGLDASAKGKKRINLFQALAVLISKKWKSLDHKERKVYEDMAQQEMAAYRKKLGDYQIQLVRKSMNATGEDNSKKNDDSDIASTINLKLPPAKPSLPSAAAAPMSDSLMDPSQAGSSLSYDALLGRPTNSLVFGGNSGSVIPAAAGMFSSSLQAQLNNNLSRAAQLGGSESPAAVTAMSNADLQKRLIQTPGASFQPGSSHASDTLAQLARQQQNAYGSVADSFAHGQLQQGLAPSYVQDLLFAQHQQNLLGGLVPSFGVHSQHLPQQQGDILQRLHALQQPGARNTLSPSSLDPSAASLYGFVQASHPSMGAPGLSPEFQAFLQQQQQAYLQQQQHGSSNLGSSSVAGDSWNTNLLSSSQRGPSTGVGSVDWSSLSGGRADPSVLTTATPTPAMMSYLPAGSGGGGAYSNNQDHLSEMLRILQQKQQQQQQQRFQHYGNF